MGAGGEDIQLSPLARASVGYSIECKNLNAISVYKYYEQAKTHGQHEPLVVIKQNNSKPLAIVDLQHFLELVRRSHDVRQN